MSSAERPGAARRPLPRRTALLGLALILALLALPLWLPPDGGEHGSPAQFVGRFHPLVVHAPIGLLALVPLLEIAGRAARWSHLRASAGFVLGLAAATAVTAAVLGWLLAWSGGYSGGLLTRHLWGGLGLAASSLVCCALRAHRGPDPLYGAALAATLALLAWTGHQGGQLTHGEAFLTQHMPARWRAWLSLPPPPVKRPRAVATADAELSFYAARIAPIIEEHCAACHNPNKHKADLRMDTYELLMRGGENGPVIVASDPSASELFFRITLPPDDPDIMPSDGKPPLTPDEIKVIELWIAAGASATMPAGAITGVPPLALPPAAAPAATD